MINFSLDHQSATLAHLNVRAELHGEDPQPAADLKFSWSTSNSVLAEFAPDLKSALFRPPNPDEQQELINDPAFLPHPKFPKLGGLSWSDEIVGATVTVHWGASGKGDVVLEQCTVDKFRFELVDGGSVFITLRVKCHPTEAQVGKLFSKLGCETELSIEPPSEEDALKETA